MLLPINVMGVEGVTLTLYWTPSSWVHSVVTEILFVWYSSEMLIILGLAKSVDNSKICNRVAVLLTTCIIYSFNQKHTLIASVLSLVSGHVHCYRYLIVVKLRTLERLKPMYIIFNACCWELLVLTRIKNVDGSCNCHWGPYILTAYTTVLFKSRFTESIIRVEISGELPWAEILMKVNVVEFTLISDICWGPSCEMNLGYSWSLPCSFLTETPPDESSISAACQFKLISNLTNWCHYSRGQSDHTWIINNS